MRRTSLSDTKLSSGTQRDLGRIRAVVRFDCLLIQKYHPGDRARMYHNHEILRVIERIARREVAL